MEQIKKKRRWVLRFLAAAVGGLLLGALVGAPAQAAEQRGAGIALTALSVEQETVDATSGSGTVTVDWTVTDGNEAATDMFGALTIQQVGDDGALIGAPHDLTFSFQPQYPYQANAVAGTIAAAEYSYAFQVPQYAARSTVRWAVVKVTAKDDQGRAASIGRQQLADFHAEFAATELVDSTGPAYDGFSLDLGQPAYLYNVDEPVTVRYRLHISDAESGFLHGQLLLTGPQGATASGSIRLVPDYDGSMACGNDGNYDSYDVFCTVEVTIPAGAPAGDWSPSRLRLTDESGNVSVSRTLPQSAVHAVHNDTLQASEFTISPQQFNNWDSVANLTVTLKPSDVQGGITSVTVLSDKCGSSVVDHPVVAPDGTISARLAAGPIYTTKCAVTGIGLTDSAGESAAYGVAFHGPAVDLVATQIPDTAAPVVNAASLAADTFAADSLPGGTDLTLDVTSFVGVTGFNLSVYDADGNPVDGRSGGTESVTDGPLVLPVPLHDGMAPGTYTVGFTLTDAGGLHASYGYPSGSGLPVPAGPLIITVTGA